MLKILERIDFRSNSGNRELLLEELDNLAIRMSEKNETDYIKIYMHHNIGTDFSIHLHRNIIGDEKFESELGVRLASSLKEYGFVNHTVWIEM